ncbi:arginine--tRNA ligase [Fusibacter ferrireducens]|uniref:Arginine--tRNA ligase n=1 Tax=Fusibacter ferrireducens TaxID=2785058 RepID=A0ABR9ZUI9_9FIRM|nr:arginine--tRNA ligase [Fusibacter ferrireducens]MBF4694103.1 arginine--tRNA ligase [Fusibacter ferrireducens]
MKTLLEELSTILTMAFEEAGVSSRPIEVSYSRRPDLCDFQCNSALKHASSVSKKPLVLAEEVAKILKKKSAFLEVSAEKPGFINLKLAANWVSKRLKQMNQMDRLGCKASDNPQNLLVDFGGANVAKSLHVGHLRSAVIGESLIRLLYFTGHNVIGDIHLGDWGLQMGYVIEMVRLKDASLPYFEETTLDGYPEEPPFDIVELTELYTQANIKSKSDEAFKAKAAQATVELQKGRKGYLALWHHIMTVSKADLKKNYDQLQVHFDLWLGESDSQKHIPYVLKHLDEMKLLVESEGAKVVHVAKASDKKPMPPCIMQKSNGAALYATTDLATIYQRTLDKNLDGIIYVVDKRQELHFEQVFRVAHISQMVSPALNLKFIGFGTMNGLDGKPFKTRDGGVMALSDLIEMITKRALIKLEQYSQLESHEEKTQAALKIGVGALKFADLSNQTDRDYVFDMEQFTSFEGKTGPYIQYAIVRMTSILNKLSEQKTEASENFSGKTAIEKALMIKLAAFSDWVHMAAETYQPSKICDYAFDVAQTFNTLYHEVHVLYNSKKRQSELMSLLNLTREILEECLWLLGIETLEKM